MGSRVSLISIQAAPSLFLPPTIAWPVKQQSGKKRQPREREKQEERMNGEEGKTMEVKTGGKRGNKEEEGGTMKRGQNCALCFPN